MANRSVAMAVADTSSNGDLVAQTIDTTAMTPENSGEEFVEFAHGTTRESGLDIVDNGVNYEAGVEAMFGSKEPGSFFTVRVDPSQPYEALSTVASWGARHGGSVAVVIVRLPQAVVERLEAAGLLVHRIRPMESIFRPRSFETVNHEAEWDIIHVRG